MEVASDLDFCMSDLIYPLNNIYKNKPNLLFPRLKVAWQRCAAGNLNNGLRGHTRGLIFLVGEQKVTRLHHEKFQSSTTDQTRSIERPRISEVGLKWLNGGR